MKVEKQIIDRFNSLINFIENLMKQRHISAGYEVKDELSDFMGYEPRYISASHDVDKQGALQWQMSCLQLFSQVFGKECFYISEFKHHTRFIALEDNYKYLVNSLGILKAAKDDYENIYIFNARTLIEAEVFDDFLEQSEHLLNQGYFIASAVIAGSVLEDTLRKLCVKNGIALTTKPKLDTMNAELAKANVYNLFKQKQITAIADLRNKAAHGQGGFTKEDVEDMIRNVRRFMEDYFS